MATTNNEIIEVLKTIAPGTPIREGLENILKAKTGGLIVIGDGKEVMDIADGGFKIDVDYTPARLYELAKMDGAIIISSDLKRILWYTKSKTIDEAQVSFDTIKDLTIGQISESFMKYPLKMLEDYSFSIYYKTKDDDEIKTLDLTCKNQKEFDLWVIGIKALHAHYNGKVISKNDLLSHSKSYNEQVKKGNIGHCTKFLFYDDKTATSDISTKKGENNAYF